MNAILMLMLAADPGGHAGQDIVLLDFTASYCQPCQQMVPHLQRMEKDGYPIQKVDITEQHDLSRRFRVDRIPTLVLLVEGKEVKRFVGFTAEEELRREMRIARDQLLESRGELPETSDSGIAQSKNSNGPSEDRTPAVTTNRSEQRSLRDLFKGMFQRDKPSGFEFPTVRAQDADLDVAVSGSLANAADSSVRIRVTGDKLQDVGTGTIVYSVPGQSLILTCAHLFADQDESARIEVDVFRNGQVSRFPARIVGGDHNADLAVVQIQNASVLPFVSVSSPVVSVAPSQPAVSFGCDNGRIPTSLQTKVLKINQYTGPANLTCARDPVQGRSGGGLFNQNGQLIAVCSCADRDNQEGLYMSQPAILDLMQKLKLNYAVNAGKSASGEDPAEAFAAAQEQSRRQLQPAAPQPATVAANDLNANAALAQESPAFDEIVSAIDAASRGQAAAMTASLPDPFRETEIEQQLQSAGTAAAEILTEAQGSLVNGLRGIDPNAHQLTHAAASRGTRITVLIDSDQPGVNQRMIVIPNATPWLMELLSGESPQQAAVQPTSARTAAPGHVMATN